MQVKIDRLQIRLRGIRSETAQVASRQIGPELLQQLTTRSLALARGSTRLADLEAGSVSVGRGIGGTELGHVIAEHIVRTIGESLKRNGK